MAYEMVSNTIARKGLRVRVPPPALRVPVGSALRKVPLLWTARRCRISI
jgi:hypothetical protein